MKKILFLAFAFGIFLALASCGEGTDVVPSGTYEGTIQKVVPDESEIYVKTDDGKTLELYFIEETTLTRNGEPAEFSALEKGQKVEVTVEKTGKRLDPVAVNIME